MKEFIDKLIERLEQERKIAYNTYMNYEMNVDLGRSFGAERAIDIANELAEEYINCSTDISTKSTDCSTKVSEIPTGWISVSERLPEYTDEYNVTVDVASEFGCYRTVKTLRFERIEGKEPKWVIPQDEVYRVIAWCELPAPYTEGERI